MDRTWSKSESPEESWDFYDYWPSNGGDYLEDAALESSK